MHSLSPNWVLQRLQATSCKMTSSSERELQKFHEGLQKAICQEE
jgi:hypothetical protein